MKVRVQRLDRALEFVVESEWMPPPIHRADIARCRFLDDLGGLCLLQDGGGETVFFGPYAAQMQLSRAQLPYLIEALQRFVETGRLLP